MRKKGFLGEFEQLVLLAVLRLDAEAYAVPIRAQIEQRTGAVVARGAVYVTLDRLEQKGLLASRLGEATEARRGRPRRYYRLRPTAMAALRESRTALLSMWDGLEPELEQA